MLGSVGQFWRKQQMDKPLPGAKEVALQKGSEIEDEEAVNAAQEEPRQERVWTRVYRRMSTRTWYFLLSAALGTLLLAFLLAAFVRSGAHFQSYLDRVQTTRHDMLRLEVMPADVHDVHNEGFSITSSPIVQLPRTLRVDAFRMAVMDMHDRIIARVDVPAYGRDTKNTTMHVKFEPSNYLALHRMVRSLSFGGKFMAKVDANITAKTMGIPSSGRFQRVIHMPRKRFRKMHERGQHRRSNPRMDFDASMMMAELLVAQIMNPAGTTVVMKHPTTNLRADLGRVRFGMFLDGKRLIDLTTEAAIEPFETTFAFHQSTYLPDAIAHVNATVHGLTAALRNANAHKELPPRAMHAIKLPVQIIGEHSHAADWLNIIVRSLQRSIPVPLPVLQGWLVRNGVSPASLAVNVMSDSTSETSPRAVDTVPV